MFSFCILTMGLFDRFLMANLCPLLVQEWEQQEVVDNMYLVDDMLMNPFGRKNHSARAATSYDHGTRGMRARIAVLDNIPNVLPHIAPEISPIHALRCIRLSLVIDSKGY
jgi:hypothetical protein